MPEPPRGTRFPGCDKDVGLERQPPSCPWAAASSQPRGARGTARGGSAGWWLQPSPAGFEPLTPRPWVLPGSRGALLLRARLGGQIPSPRARACFVPCLCRSWTRSWRWQISPSPLPPCLPLLSKCRWVQWEEGRCRSREPLRAPRCAGTEQAGTEQAGTEQAGTEQAAPCSAPLPLWVGAQHAAPSPGTCSNLEPAALPEGAQHSLCGAALPGAAPGAPGL